MHAGDQTESDHNRNRVRVDHCVRHPLKELEALDEVGDHGLANPAQRQADNGDSQLHAVDNLVQIAVKAQQYAGANSTALDQLLDSGVTNCDEGKLSRGKKGIGRNQEHNKQDPEQHEGKHLSSNSNIARRS
jgi:hypothetical protein